MTGETIMELPATMAEVPSAWVLVDADGIAWQVREDDDGVHIDPILRKHEHHRYEASAWKSWVEDFGPITVLFRPDAPKSAPTDDATGGHLALLRQRYVGLVYADALDTEVAERAGHEFDQAIATALAAAGAETPKHGPDYDDPDADLGLGCTCGYNGPYEECPGFRALAARGDAATPTVTAAQRNAAIQAMLTAHANPPGPGYDETAWAMGAVDSALHTLGIEVTS